MTTEPTEDPQALLAKADKVSEALVKCQGALKAAEFDATNPFFKSKYATLGSVIAASREALFKSGLAVLQVPSIQGDLVSVHTRIVHSSGQSLDCGVMSLSLGESERNSDAQIAGSIITYLRRYSWASILGIYADTDDDGNSGPQGAQKPVGAIPKQKPAPPAPPQATPPAEASDKARIRALHLLLGCPGEKNRLMVKDYLVAKGWITVGQEPEDWPLFAVPRSKEDMAKLAEDVQNFHAELASQKELLQEEIIP